VTSEALSSGETCRCGGNYDRLNILVDRHDTWWLLQCRRCARRRWLLTESDSRHDRPRRSSAATAEYDGIEHAREIYVTSLPATNTLIETYLRARGITIPPPPPLRYAPRLRYARNDYRPAMVAAIQDVRGDITGVHRTFLCADGSGKADVESPKKMLGRCVGGAVRLAPAVETLAVAEGIETGLSILQATKLPTWVTLGTGGLAHLELPVVVETIIIVADGDEPGVAAAEKPRDVRHGRAAACGSLSRRPGETPTTCSACRLSLEAHDVAKLVDEAKPYQLTGEGPKDNQEPAEARVGRLLDGNATLDREALLEGLSRLSPAVYAQYRERAAQRLGNGEKPLSLTHLDREMDQRWAKRSKTDLAVSKTTAHALASWKVEPWVESVSTKSLLDELEAFIHGFVILSKHAAFAVALWVMHAWTIEATDWTPILSITSPSKRCGKTRLLNLIGEVTPRPIKTANISAAVFYRVVDAHQPTALMRARMFPRRTGLRVQNHPDRRRWCTTGDCGPIRDRRV
jgi:hypothetical protein